MMFRLSLWFEPTLDIRGLTRRCINTPFAQHFLAGLLVFFSCFGQPKAAEELRSVARQSVALVGIYNATGDPTLDFWRCGLSLMLGEQFQRLKGIRYVPWDWSTTNIGAAAAQEIGQRCECRRVIWGSYAIREHKWLVTFHVENVATGKVSPDLSESSEDWFEIRDKLIDDVLQELRIRPNTVERKELYHRYTDSTQALEYLCKASCSDFQNDWPGAERFARQVIETDPHCAKAHEILSAALGSMGQLGAAEKEVRIALDLWPQSSQAHCVLGIIYMMHEHYDAAEKELKASLRFGPDNPQTLIRLGEICEARNSRHQGIRYYEQAVRIAEFSASAHAHLGGLYATEGNRERATPELRIAGKLSAARDQNTEQQLAVAYSTLGDLGEALYHTKAFLAIAEKVNVNPETIRLFQDRLRNLQARESVHFVTATQPKTYSAQDLEQELHQKLTNTEIERVRNPLASSAEMKLWAQQITAGVTDELTKARMLFEALIQHVDTGTQGRRTAEQAFQAWKKPGTMLFCQEYAYLYVALARAVGLRAYVVSVTESSDGSQILHACAAVFLDKRALLVDPADFWFGAPHKRFEVLNDVQTTADYLAESEMLMETEIATKLDPTSAFVQGNLIMLLMEKNRWEEARQRLVSYVQLSQDPAFADYLQAHLALHENRVNAALELLRNCLALSPDFAQAHLLLAVTYEDEGKLEEARESFRNALRCELNGKNEKHARRALAEINEKLTGQ